MATISKNARGQVTIDGVPRFLRAVYDAGLPTAGWPAFIGPAGRNLARYKFDIILNVQTGTFGNGLDLANALVPFGMYTLAVCNFFGNFTFPPASFSPATPFNSVDFDTTRNPTYTTTPEGTGPFRTLWSQKAAAIAQYIADEPAWHASPWSGNPAAQTNDGRDDVVLLHDYNKSVLPSLPTMVTLLNDNLTQYQEWSPLHVGDWLGPDIYTVGQAPEQFPDNGTIPSTYGYMNFSVGEAGALSRYYGAQFSRVPMIILQANKFGGRSRFITPSEMQSHMVIALAELRGVGIIWWWALGVQSGALDERPFLVQSGNGSNRVFNVPDYVEEAIDVEVKIANVIQAPSSYTIQNLGDASIVKVGNFYQLVHPPTVTMNVAPPSGTSNVVVTSNKWPTAKRTAALNQLEAMTLLLSQLEPITLQPSNPGLLTGNSTDAATFLAWRIPYCNALRNGGADRPVWLFGAVARYQAEYDALQLVPPDMTYSNHIADQKADVRTCCWESGATGLVAAYNLNPNPNSNVTLQWHTTITRVEVLGENRDVPVTGGRNWTDTFGGASSLRQGSFNQGHLYRLTLSSTPQAFTLLLAAGAYQYTVAGPPVVLTWAVGPTLLGFVVRR